MTKRSVRAVATLALDRIVTKVSVHLVLDDRNDSNPHVPIIVATKGNLDNPYQPG